ncbi:hypothetical protein K6W80_13055, partial [Burkholderia contaminans]|uniref:hypothetical protein n=1 Tax=Burkholderia contaminans TaxID=488447 RepID=UPI001C97DEEE
GPLFFHPPPPPPPRGPAPAGPPPGAAAPPPPRARPPRPALLLVAALRPRISASTEGPGTAAQADHRHAAYLRVAIAAAARYSRAASREP